MNQMRFKMRVATIALFFAMSIFVACSKEKSEPLPDLAPIEIPKDVFGKYSGRLPCDDCDTKIVRMTLEKDGNAVAEITKVLDSLKSDTAYGTYIVTDSIIQVALSNNTIRWNFKRGKFGNISFIAANGEVYKDANGMRADFIRVYKTPKQKIDTAKVQKE